MAFTQVRFQGASIRNFNASLGWSNQASQLTVQLVEDVNNGDVFAPSNIGDPVSFSYQGWKFNGLLQSYKTTGDQGGNPLYDMTIIDPREILEGVQLILADYSNITYGVSNLLNVYGYWESFGYGQSDINEGGMPWKKIRDAVSNLTLESQVGNFGGPIKFSNSIYNVNLSFLPDLPEYYRVGGTHISLMDFIVDICEAGGCDFFVTMEQTSAAFTIQINIIDRRSVQVLGKISQFISNTDGVSSRNYGYELLNNNTSKFVAGGNVEYIYYQYYQDYDNDNDGIYDDNTIWPFWGFDAAGNAILGTGFFESNEHRFTLDARTVNIYGVGAYYPTNVGELRASLDSFEAWQYYLMINDNITTSPQYLRYTKLGGISPVGDFWTDLLNGVNSLDALQKMPWSRLAAITRRQAKLARLDNTDPNTENMMRLYDYVRSFANEYYGKKFMVRVPFIYIKQESETNRIVLSQEPIDSGFLEEATWPNAIGANLLPFDVDRLTTEEGKIEAYVRFDNGHLPSRIKLNKYKIAKILGIDITTINSKNFANLKAQALAIAPPLQLDLSQLGPDDYIFSEDGLSVFVKCKVESFIVYLNAETQFSPRAVIELAGPVRPVKNYTDQSMFTGQLVDVLTTLFEDKNNAVKFGIPPGPPAGYIDNLVSQTLHIWSTQGASEGLFMGHPGMALLPEFVALPLRNTLLTYGPWYATGANGKLEFERDETLVPWNYAGFEIMNLAGDAKVSEALIQQQILETGTIEYAGVPTVPLGSTLVSAGPYVTDIRVAIAENGATTTYQMQLSPRFGKFAKANVERFTRLAKTAQKFRRILRRLLKTPAPTNKIFKLRENILYKPSMVSNKSSHIMLHAECLPADSGIYNINVSTQPTYNMVNQSYDEYPRKALVSLDAVLVPFSTNTDASGIPKYRSISPGSGDISRTQLDPFTNNHGISLISRDEEFPERGLHGLDGYSVLKNYRSVGLRGPVMIAGWGYDINNNPVPIAPSGDSANPSGDITAFLSYHKQKPDQWKVGPLDVRWDNTKGVWSAGPPASIDATVKLGQLITDITAPSGIGQYTGFYIQKFEDGTQLACTNYDTSLSVSVGNSGIFVGAIKVKNQFVPFWVGCG